jgi:putative ABC transport system ATP-binding protein
MAAASLAELHVPLRISGVAAPAREERVRAMLTVVGLADHARHRPGERRPAE